MDRSGLLLIADNHDAFAIRALLAREARHTLDLMYYLWRDDRTGSMLSDEVIKAAERGVRVRVLLDDINPYNSDVAQQTLEDHANIELKLFNPSRARHGSIWHAIELVANSFSLTRRMHNKAWIADDAYAVIGGRNIADEYFDAGETNFRDLDVLMQGAAVAQTKAIFELFWNCKSARPVGEVEEIPRRRQKKWQPRASGAQPEQHAQTLLDRVAERGSVKAFIKASADIHWMQSARVISDPPEKARGRRRENWLLNELLDVIEAADRSLELTSPYFIPGKRGVAILRSMKERGVEATVLTNSLAATDVAAVHGAYAHYRIKLLKIGVHLHELQPFARRKTMSVFGSKGASLHTKAFTVDDHSGFVGSFNFDPRSASLNTEMGVVFDDVALVADLRALFRRETAPDTSYHLSLQSGRLHWYGEENGRMRDFTHEPEASIWRRMTATLVRLLPIESQL